MTAANDNDPRERHAATVLRQLSNRRPVPLPRERLEAGIAYARAHDPAELDKTLAIGDDDVLAVARRVLREGDDLTQAGAALSGYGTETQARAWAAAKLESALGMLAWHRQRIEKEQLLAQYRAWSADQRAIKAARAAIPLR